MEKGMLIDAFAAIEFLAEKKLTAGPPAKGRINRQMLAHPASASYFSVNMESGRWFEMAGDHGASYEKYKMAHGIDPYREDALVGIVDEAVKIGMIEEAADYYIKLLKLERLANSRHDTLLEQSLSGKCGVCRKLPLEKKPALAKNLARAQKWELAYALFKNIITARPNWPDTVKKLEAGKSVKLKDAVGEVVAGKMRDFTIYELQKILQAGKITLYHPGDMPEKIDGVSGSLIVESAPKIRLQIYEGFYKTDSLPARAAISWDGMDSSNSSTTQGGYLAVVIKKGAAPLKKFYPDTVPHIAGNRRLIDDLESLKRGESILLARVSIFKTHMKDGLQAALSTVGVDPGLLQGPMSAHVIMGTKGMPLGMGKLFKGDYSVRKVFTPPNMDDAKRTNLPALTVTGTGEDATVKYIARKK